MSKSDVGTYSYPKPGSPQPHAVMSVSGGSISTTFTYDADGNQTSGLGRSIVFTSYNKPASITQGTRTISFLDDTDHQRFKQVTPEGSTLYISAFGVLTELTNPGASSQKWTDYLSVGDAQVGMRVLQTASETLSTRYFHTDHLGSISVITDQNGNVVERLSYDVLCVARLPDFGGLRGMVIGLTRRPAYAIDNDIKSAAESQGLFYTFINADVYERYDEEIFKEALADWGFFGNEDRRPDWLQKPTKNE